MISRHGSKVVITVCMGKAYEMSYLMEELMKSVHSRYCFEFSFRMPGRGYIFASCVASTESIIAADHYVQSIELLCIGGLFSRR